MGHSAALPATRPRRRGPVAALAVVATAALCAGAPGVPLSGCGGASQAAPAPAVSPQATGALSQATGALSQATGALSQATGAAPTTGCPSPVPVVTAGPVPPGAARAAVRFWRLLDAHRQAALLGVLTPDSRAAAAVRAGRADAFWGIARVRVVSVDATVGRTPPAGATLEFAMTIDVRPTRATPWRAGRNLVFMSLRRVGGAWLVYQTGSGP
jgi:hypothetical protein